jgi:phosphohistidine swiveling domain-containing protein
MQHGASELHFTVEAAFVVKYARDQVLSKDWRGALRTLTAIATPQLSLDQAVAILKGELTLVNTEDDKVALEPQPQDCPDLLRYLNTAHWQHGGILERDGEFYQAYAEITSFDDEDGRPVLERMREDGGWCTVAQFCERRARPYMERPFDDIVCLDAGPNPVLFQRVQGPAFWMKTFTDAAEAMADFRNAKRWLKQTGGTGRNACRADSIDFFFEAAKRGYLTRRFGVAVPGADGQLLETIMDMRDRFDNGEGADDDPWRSDESRFEDAVDALYWKSRVDQAAQANGGFLDIVAGRGDDQVTYRVARNPFLLWASERGYARKHGVLPEWDTVCPSGMKMYGDNPLHTDWWVSSGLPFRAAYDHDHPLNRAAWKLAYAWQYVEGAKCLKLAGKGKVTGMVVFPKPNEAVPAGSIAVVSHAGPDYQLALTSACKGATGAVIAEVGGKLAHLAVISRELGARLAVVDEALTKFKEGEVVTIDFDTGELQIHGREDDPNLDD